MRAMLIDDETQRAPVKTIRKLLEAEGVFLDPSYEFLGKLGADDFCDRVQRLDGPPDLAVIDYSLHWKDLNGGEWNGDRVARFLREQWAADVPFYILFISSYLKSMATPYKQLVDLLKVPFAGFVELGPQWEEDVRQHVRWACDLVRAEKRRLITTLEGVETFFGETIIGRAPSLIQAGHIASRVSPTDASVLITGKSGTGKELVARAIHHASLRARGPFVAVNCGAVAKDIAESEFFGHRKGAFTGALEDRKGYFEAAEGGTLFLDEIGEMALDLQVKVLRVLDGRSIVRTGEVNPRDVDFRIIAATNRQVMDEIKAGRFREDLYYRINTIEVAMPTLRERASDVLDLADFFLQEAATKYTATARRFSQNALRALRSYAWPGNVRELKHAVERAVLLCDGATVELDHLPDGLRGGSVTTDGNTWKEAEEEFKRSYFRKMLEESQGHITNAAKGAGLSREHFSKTLKQLGIDVPEP